MTGIKMGLPIAYDTARGVYTLQMTRHTAKRHVHSSDDSGTQPRGMYTLQMTLAHSQEAYTLFR